MARSGKVVWSNVVTVLSATVIVLTQTVATAFAAAWAVSGLFNLGAIGEYGLAGLFGLFALYLSVTYFRKAAKAEALRA